MVDLEAGGEERGARRPGRGASVSVVVIGGSERELGAQRRARG
jgi:hypothetical protein